MSIFSSVESGTQFHRTRFTKSISNTMKYNCRFHELIPVLKRFCLPGDIWKISGDCLVRFLPMASPSLTPNNFRVRYFFVPLRLIDKNTELIITGSKEGHLFNGELPTFPNFVAQANKSSYPNAYKVQKYSFWDYMNVQCTDYEAIKTDECLPAWYWYTAYERIWFDYYRDENLNSSNDFESLISAAAPLGADVNIEFSKLKKDYFMSCLPWQLKGTAPVLSVSGSGTFTPDFNIARSDLLKESSINNNFLNDLNAYGLNEALPNAQPLHIPLKEGQSADVYESVKDAFVTKFNNMLNSGGPQDININAIGFTADDLRTMMAQTRIFERLARSGSRYTEYLRSNFGISPADGTLQRAQYLGGWKIPIVTTEVLQTAADGSNPVGTMRGHGITRGGNSIKTFHCNEFGVLFGLAEICPNVEYTTGVPRQLSYKKRFDFFNPSLQHLSEQEVRNGELFISNSDGKNDETFGFQAYANELRSANDETVADMRDSLSFWTQSLHFSSRPNLNNNLVTGSSHQSSFNAPFIQSGANARNIIVQFKNQLDVYRPMVRYATPGLVDHL